MGKTASQTCHEYQRVLLQQSPVLHSGHYPINTCGLHKACPWAVFWSLLLHDREPLKFSKVGILPTPNPFNLRGLAVQFKPRSELKRHKGEGLVLNNV